MSERPPTPRISLDKEIRRSLEGAARLFLFDASAMELFTVSLGGFWRSFLAAVIAAPPIAASFWITDRLLRTLPRLDIALAPLPTRIGAEAVAYPLRWALFPVLMIGLARLLKVTDRYVPYIIAYNWSSVIASLVGLAPLLLYAAGLADPRTALAAVQGLQLIIWVYLWFIARTGLRIGTFTAVAIVLIDVLSTLLLDRGIAIYLGEASLPGP